MKENEEPEKIYCIPTEGGCYYITTIKPEPPFADGVEYTRTDAFIEKASRWIEENVDMYEAFDPDSKTYYTDKEQLVNDFIKAMKGE